MAKTLTHVAEFPYSAEEVFQTGIRKDYIEAKSPALGPRSALAVAEFFDLPAMSALLRAPGD